MSTFILKRKAFTQYDETDNLKRMKDSDILAEKPKKPESGPGAVIAPAATGALAGATVGGGIGLAKGISKFGKARSGVVAAGKEAYQSALSGGATKDAAKAARDAAKNLAGSKSKVFQRGLGGNISKYGGKGLVIGATAGGILLAHKAIKKRAQDKKEAEFYNDRLEYAQRQARRREKQDWKSNMTQRDGYSY